MRGARASCFGIFFFKENNEHTKKQTNKNEIVDVTVFKKRPERKSITSAKAANVQDVRGKNN
jgi:hypothetical protein